MTARRVRNRMIVVGDRGRASSSGTGGRASVRAAAFEPPTRIIADRYELMDEIGDGGMGVVHRAFDHVTELHVAVKLVHAHLARDPAVRLRMKREARLHRKVNHPNVVHLFDAGETDDAGMFLVFELLAGPTLAACLTRTRRVPQSTVVSVGVQLLRGLEAIHATGIVHRDVKPENVIALGAGDSMDVAGVVKLLDFGIARPIESTRQRDIAAITQLGTTVGTPAYMAPEQVLGLPRQDERTDIYSVGVLLYEMLSQHLPHPTVRNDGGFGHLFERAAVPIRQYAPDVDPGLARIIHTALERMPECRFESAMQFRQRLESWRAGELAARTSRPSGRPTFDPGRTTERGMKSVRARSSV